MDRMLGWRYCAQACSRVQGVMEGEVAASADREPR